METFPNGRTLVPHPAHPGGAVGRVTCSMVCRDAGNWALDFFVDAPPAALKLPAAAAPERTDDLWEATCFELFLRGPDGGYLEFNFSPSGQWAAYRFDSYREGMRPLDVARPLILTRGPAQFATSMEAQLRENGVAPELAKSWAADGAATVGGRERTHFTLSAMLEDAGLCAYRPTSLGLSAIIDESDGTRSYWALAHPPGDPDFHHPDCFALRLPAAASA